MGIKAVLPDCNTTFTVIHNGIETSRFYNKKNKRDQKSFITIVSGAESSGRMLLKGVDLILENAAKNPNYTFTIIGCSKISGYTGVLNNVILLDKIDNEQLAEHLNRSKYYLQLSMSEGFGIALCEAMSCGCIPIVSNVGIMPEIIADTGYVLLKRNAELLNNLLKTITHEDNNMKSMKAAERIREFFHIQKREKALLDILASS
ncbi:MAG: glycosyltransferase [Saprospiraceae bacterium]|nr:glycosyltransferase [Saprospiraceae bacterium]